jgi:hypothetical protein
MFTKAESAQPYIYSIFTPAGNCWHTAKLEDRTFMSAIIQKLIRTAESLGASTVSRAVHADQLLIVMYHGILPERRA